VTLSTPNAANLIESLILENLVEQPLAVINPKDSRAEIRGFAVFILLDIDIIRFMSVICCFW
ncbi:hypothetical protein, partial [Vibrio anguillarum]|uniref:hypothetical protein n=1 Tax=Vibrio anguillarum TaxID=55601 RepID=UPI001BE4A84C